MEKLNKMKKFLKKKKKQVEKIIEAPEQQRKIQQLELENGRLRGMYSYFNEIISFRIYNALYIFRPFSMTRPFCRSGLSPQLGPCPGFFG